MIVVADASPVISLGRIGQLDLVHVLFGAVLLPEQVIAEIRSGTGGPQLLDSAPWLTAACVKDTQQLALLESSLDSGEAAAIILALEKGADVLLMDEKRGRRIAAERGLQVIGVLGILVRAREAGLVEEMKPVIERLVTEAGMRLSSDVVEAALRAVGEEA